MDYSKDDLFYPRSLYGQVIDNIGYVPPIPSGTGDDPEIVRSHHLPGWSLRAAVIFCLDKLKPYHKRLGHF